MSIPLIETHYLPCVAFFTTMIDAPSAKLEAHEHFQKQSYRNRCYINTSQGREALIIPLTGKRGKVSIKDVRIDYSQKWLNNHWRTIVSAYNKAPFFEYYASDLEKILFQRHAFLFDLNYHLLSMCLAWLKWDITVEETLSYEKVVEPTLKDLRSLIHPKETHLIEKFFQPVQYYQVFGNRFVENLSVIDLIFCKGPEAGWIIQRSSRRV